LSTGWASAFPLKPASDAVTAVCEAWNFYASKHRAHFNRKTHEPQLTKHLCCYISRVTAPKLGLLGTWAAEAVIGDLDLWSGEITEERRTDIMYGWNDDTAQQKMQLVFEFKRLKATKGDRDHYLGERGLQRFVKGIYSHGEERAFMVGILLAAPNKVLPLLKAEFANPPRATALDLIVSNPGVPLIQPATFVQADFDSLHRRLPPQGPAKGCIQVSHMFLEFAYP
jgi:hypothetical protein